MRDWYFKYVVDRTKPKILGLFPRKKTVWTKVDWDSTNEYLYINGELVAENVDITNLRRTIEHFNIGEALMGSTAFSRGFPATFTEKGIEVLDGEKNK